MLPTKKTSTTKKPSLPSPPPTYSGAASSFAASTSGASSISTTNSNIKSGHPSFHASAASFAEAVVAVPQMGDSITEGAVASVDVSVGDIVSEDALIAQIETDKVTIDVRYTGKEPGKVTGVLVKAGDTVEVGTPVATI